MDSGKRLFLRKILRKNFFPGGTNHDVIWLAEQASTNEDFGETANFLKHLTFRKIGSFFYIHI